MKKFHPEILKWTMSLSIVAAMALVSMVLTENAAHQDATVAVHSPHLYYASTLTPQTAPRSNP